MLAKTLWAIPITISNPFAIKTPANNVKLLLLTPLFITCNHEVIFWFPTGTNVLLFSAALLQHTHEIKQNEAGTRKRKVQVHIIIKNYCNSITIFFFQIFCFTDLF